MVVITAKLYTLQRGNKHDFRDWFADSRTRYICNYQNNSEFSNWN